MVKYSTDVIKILMIHYFFPPRGGATVQRIIKFCKYLPQFGVEVTVLTSGSEYNIQDESLLLSISPNIKVHTTFSPGEMRAIEGQFERRLFRLDTFSHWVPIALKHARRIIIENQIDVVFTTSPPHSQQLIGYKLKKSMGIPWISDFRDPWTSDLRFMKNKSMISQISNLWTEKKILKNADCVIATTPSATNEFRNKLSCNTNKFNCIPNGYDPDDYLNDVNQNTDNSKCKFTYIGSTGPMISDPKGFFKALHKVVNKYPVLASKLSVDFLGGLDVESVRLVEKLKLKSIVSNLGFLPHDAAMKYMMDTDVLLLFEYSVDSSIKPTRVIPSKLFEYMGARKPIFAIAIEGDTANVIRKYNLGKVVNPYNHEQIENTIVKYIEDCTNRNIDKMPSPPNCFSRIAQAKELAGLISEISSKKYRA